MHGNGGRVVLAKPVLEKAEPVVRVRDRVGVRVRVRVSGQV